MSRRLKILASLGMVGTLLGLYLILWGVDKLPIWSSILLVGMTSVTAGFVLYEIWTRPRVGISLNVLSLAVVLSLTLLSFSLVGDWEGSMARVWPGGLVMIGSWLVGTYPVLFMRPRSAA